jgi:hypothetical protein
MSGTYVIGVIVFLLNSIIFLFEAEDMFKIPNWHPPKELGSFLKIGKSS